MNKKDLLKQTDGKNLTQDEINNQNEQGNIILNKLKLSTKKD